MHAKNKFVCLIAILLAAFALPSVAGNDKKIYNLQTQIVSSSPPFTVQATLTSEPTGNSSFNSFSLSVVGLQITGIVGQPTSGNATFTASSVTVVNASPVKPGASISVTLQVSSCGDGAWSASAWTGAKLNGQSFDLVPAHSMLGTSIPCGNLANGAAFTVPDTVNPNCVSGTRDYYDKDGTIPIPVPYFVTNTLSAPVNGQLHFRWPTVVADNGDPAAAFEYSVCGPGTLPAGGLDTQVAWLTDVGGYPVYIVAPDCIAPNQLPAPYGTLEGAISDDATSITVDALSFGFGNPHGAIQHAAAIFGDPSSYFDIVIGTERMTVTAVSSDDGPGGDLSEEGPSEFEEHEVELEVWTVIRHVGGTLAAAHADDAPVMSTPLPLLPLTGVPPPYVAGHQAQMCIADQQTVGSSHFTKLIDIGDGYTKLP